MSDKKTCKGCGETKPVDEFQKTGKLYKDGTPKYYGKCKLCMNAYKRTYNAANPDKRAKFYALTKEWVDKNRDFVNKSQREYSKLHPEKRREAQKRWRAKNPDKAKEDNSTEKAKTAKKLWWKNNPDRYKESKDEWRKKNLRYFREYRKLHPEISKNHARLRRLRKLGTPGYHAPAEWEALKAATGNKCLCCGVNGDEVALTRDHVVPLSKGGTDDISNIQPLCASCNSKKRARTIDYRG